MITLTLRTLFVCHSFTILPVAHSAGTQISCVFRQCAFELARGGGKAVRAMANLSRGTLSMLLRMQTTALSPTTAMLELPLLALTASHIVSGFRDIPRSLGCSGHALHVTHVTSNHCHLHPTLPPHERLDGKPAVDAGASSQCKIICIHLGEWKIMPEEAADGWLSSMHLTASFPASECDVSYMPLPPRRRGFSLRRLNANHKSVDRQDEIMQVSAANDGLTLRRA